MASIEVDRIRANGKDVEFRSATLWTNGRWWVQLRGGNLEKILGEDVVAPALLQMDLRDGRKAIGKGSFAGASGDARAAEGRVLVTLEGTEDLRFE